MFFGISHACVT